MPDASNLSAEDLTEIAQLLREWLDGDKFFLSPAHRRRKAILDKIEPPRVREPLPAPQPAGEPTWAEQVKRRRRR